MLVLFGAVGLVLRATGSEEPTSDPDEAALDRLEADYRLEDTRIELEVLKIKLASRGQPGNSRALAEAITAWQIEHDERLAAHAEKRALLDQFRPIEAPAPVVPQMDGNSSAADEVRRLLAIKRQRYGELVPDSEDPLVKSEGVRRYRLWCESAEGVEVETLLVQARKRARLERAQHLVSTTAVEALAERDGESARQEFSRLTLRAKIGAAQALLESAGPGSPPQSHESSGAADRDIARIAELWRPAAEERLRERIRSLEESIGGEQPETNRSNE